MHVLIIENITQGTSAAGLHDDARVTSFQHDAVEVGDVDGAAHAAQRFDLADHQVRRGLLLHVQLTERREET